MHSNPACPLTVRELDVMNVLWKDGPLRVRDVKSRLPVRLAYTTVLTVLRTLEFKRHVSHKADGITHVFQASVSHEEVARASIRFLKHRLCGGCAESLFKLILDESAGEGTATLQRIEQTVQKPRRSFVAGQET